MAMDMFLTFDEGAKIKGETIDKTYKAKHGIDVLAWSWGISNSGSAHVGQGAGSGKANFQDISFTKYIDLASCALMDACSLGTHIKEANLIVRKSSGDKKEPLEYLTMKLETVLVSSYSTGGSGGEDRLTENVSLNFAKVTVLYKQQAATGVAGEKGNFTYDIPANAQT
ncbi:MAG TPA: type VI secretion system tube protein Hcp [Steroidobacteraceae bacterium]|jgi:type VI secretion system secreted protein Hcp